VIRALPAVALAALVLLSAGCRSVEDWTAEGDTALRSNDLAGAERAYNRALARDPHHAPAAYGKGWALFVSRHDALKPAARQLFQRAIDYDPDYFGGYRGKGVMLLEDGQVPAAERLLREAWEKAPAEPATLESLGQLYLGAGRLDEAATMFDAATRAAPSRGELQRFVADVRIAAGDLAGARDALELGRSSAVSGVRGLALLEEGLAGLEIRVADAALRDAFSPDDPRLDEALQALSRADTVVDAGRARGVFDEEFAELRRRSASTRREVERRKAPAKAEQGGASQP
jgi:predicted Zn-dependent protease